MAAFAMLVAAGCGGGDDGGKVEVETGSLSKKEFIKQADGICESVRTRFTRQYTAFAKTIDLSAPKAELDAWGEELIERVLVPNFQQDVNRISALGAPAGDEDEIVAFLDAIQERLEQIEERPAILEETITPFAKAERLAKAYGLTGCAESFS